MQNLNPYLAPILTALDLFFESNPQTSEHDLIKNLQDKNIPPFDNLSLSLAKDLFSAHFLCMHALYHLKKQYRVSQKFTLIIQSVRIERVINNDAKFGDEESATELEVIDPLASYYLNPAHFFETQEDEINDLLKSFWQKYLAQDHKSEALQTLKLPVNADAKMIKAQFLRLAQQHHPDKGGSAEMFAKIRQAKKVLDQAL